MDLEGIVTRADGNAFFAEELLAATLACDDTQQLPWQLADLLLVRLDRLGDTAREVVRAAAVGGRRVAHEALAAVMGASARELDDALREAIDSHVLQLTSSGRGYTFRHALLAEAVYDDLLPGERVRLHAAYAAVLAETTGRRAAELARHALASHDLETAFTASVAAGDEAMTLAAPREALAHYETALELHPRVNEASVERPQLILAAVDAADAAGQTLRGVKLATAALAELPAGSPSLDRATLLYAAAKAALSGEIGVDVLEHTSEAVHLVPADPPTAFRARLLALHARVAMAMGREVDAVRSATEAVEIAEAVGSKLAATEARTSLATIERRTRAPEEAAKVLEDVIEQAASVGDAASEVRSRHSLAGLWFEQCDLPRAEAGYLAAHQRAVETGRRWDIYALMSRSMAAYVQYHRGEWDAALRTADTTGERPTAIGDGVLRGVRMLIAVGRGHCDQVLADLAQLRQYFRREGQIPLNAGFAALEAYEQRADVAGTLALIDELVEVLGELWLNPWFLARIQMSAVGISALGNAAATAPQSQHAELAAAGSELASAGRTSAEKGVPSTRELGREGRAWLARLEAESARLRWLTGEDPPSADELVASWERAIAEFDYGNVVQVARARARLAAALRATGRATEAAEQAELARAAADAMGAAPLLEQLRTLGGATRRPADADRSGLQALTDRERDVLAQLVEGRTNRQIAAQLYISEKTASVHVSNILAKLGVRSRAEAAVVARKAQPAG
jgi:DNA-binding CsgD family transcriptional regulator